MKSVLQMAYPSMRMNLVCKLCRGTTSTKCPACRMARREYIKMGMEAELSEMEYLRDTWEKCRKYKQVSTGIKKLDLVLTLLWGNPHNDNWRVYSKAKFTVNMENFIVLRLVRV